jgi:small-conductance mechanosensitive channel
MTINCLLPPLLALVSIANAVMLWLKGKELPLLDRSLIILSFIVTLSGTGVSLYGYSFLTFLGTLIWIILMSSILFISSIQVLLNQFQSKLKTKKSESSETWFRILVSKLLLPLTGIVLLVYSFLWPAGIFDMNRMLWEWTGKTYAIHDLVKSLSIKHVLLVIIIGIVINYLIHLGKHILREVYRDNYDVGGVPTIITLSSFVIWGVYLFVALAILDADYQGILMIMGGMSMGIGFALKDTIENLSCGLSLMLGRLRPGDVVECDGIRGKVDSIGYRTTFIETTDGSIIAFQNNQLFNKNFRNFTKNHLYECAKIIVGISYGTNIDEARQIILSATRKIDTLAKNKNTLVVLDNFGDNSVDLGVWVWVPVRTKAANLSRVREAIYQAFNNNGIEIPFPQRDVYIKSIPDTTNPVLDGATSAITSAQQTDNPSHE